MSLAKLVSVLIPAYNHEKFVAEAIKSVVSQTHQNLELIIVDDGSTDQTYVETLKMKDSYKDRFSKFEVIRQPNQGVATTLNVLLEQSRGEYVFIMASDDVAKPKAVEKLLRFLEDNSDYALAVGDNEFIDGGGDKVYLDSNWELVWDEVAARYRTFGAALRCEKLGENFGRYLYLYAGNHVPNGYLVKKCIFVHTGRYTRSAPLEDWFMNLQISKYSRMKYINEVLFSYRLHGNNTVVKKEYMSEISNLTFAYENSLLRNTPKDMMNKDMKYCLKYGVLNKKIDIIPNVFEIMRFKNNGKSRYVPCIFNFSLFR